jgi:hypothetical protein
MDGLEVTGDRQIVFVAKPEKAVSRGIPLATALQDAAAGTECFGTPRRKICWRAGLRLHRCRQRSRHGSRRQKPVDDYGDDYG